MATTTSEENEDLGKSLGADQCINYKEEDFSEILQDFDLVLDTMGGKVQSNSYKVVKRGGKLVSIIQPPDMQESEKYGVKAEFLWLNPKGEQLKMLADLFELGQLKPLLGETFDLREEGLRNAHALRETHHARGKIVIRVKKY